MSCFIVIRRLLLLGSVFLCLLGKSQNQKAILWLKDKGDLSISWDPLAHFSERAIIKRVLHGQRWELADFPVNQDYLAEIESGDLRVLGKSRWENAVLVEGNIIEAYSFDFVDYVHEISEQGKRIKNWSSEQDAYALSPAATPHEIVRLLKTPSPNGEGVEIAVLDAGFSGVDTISAFAHLQLGHAYNFVQPNSGVFSHGGHGTLVLSQLASTDSLERVLGFAPHANYHLFVTEDVATERLEEEFYWTLAAEQCDSLGVDIMNSSLSYTEFDNPIENHSFADLDGNTTLIARSANKAMERNILVVVSAGNYGLQPWKRIGSPADAKKVLSVGALTQQEDHWVAASFSSYGPNASGIRKPEISAPGENIAYFKPDGSVASGGGTSFSAPIISGAIATVLGNKMKYVPVDQVKEAVVQASQSFFHEYHDQMGFGWPDFQHVSDKFDAWNPSEQVYSVFPVPTQGRFSVFPKPASVSLFSVQLNQLDVQPEIGGHVFRVQDGLSTGTYFLKIEGKSGDLQVVPITVE